MSFQRSFPAGVPTASDYYVNARLTQRRGQAGLVLPVAWKVSANEAF